MSPWLAEPLLALTPFLRVLSALAGRSGLVSLRLLLGAGGDGDQVRDGHPLVQVPQSQLGPKPAVDSVDQLDRDEGVAAQVEEVVMGAHSLDTQ